jgi:hypothetical protein
MACGDGLRGDISPEPGLAEKVLAVRPAPAPTAEERRAIERAEAREARREAERARREEAARMAAAEQARLAAEQAAFDAAYPLHGVVFHFVAQVFADPSAARPIGYMRRGSQFRAKAGVRGSGCSTTWHEVPGGGFVCRGQGFLVGESPQTFEPSPGPAALDDALPYNYAFTQRDGVIQYWRLPTMAEETAAQEMLRTLREREARAASAASSAARAAIPANHNTRASAADGGVSVDAGGESPPREERDETPEASAHADSVEAPPPPGQRADIGASESNDDDILADYIRMGMLRGFYVSLDHEEQTDAGRVF